MDARADTKVIPLDSVQEERAGDLTRRVLVSPSKSGNRYLRLLHVSGKPGARGRVHTHPGEEALFTLQGTAVIEIEGVRHILQPNSAFVVPPHIEHPLEVVGDTPWIAVCTFCDDCPLIAQANA